MEPGVTDQPKEAFMQNIGLILLVFALVFACIAARWGNLVSPWSFGWLSIACWIASELIGGVARSGLLH